MVYGSSTHPKYNHKKSRVTSPLVIRSPHRGDLFPSYEEPNRDVQSHSLAEYNVKLDSIFGSIYSSSLLLNEEPLSEQIGSKTTLILLTYASTTSPATHFVEYISNTQVHVVECPVTKEPDILTLDC